MYSQQYPPGGDAPSSSTLPGDIQEQLQALEREYREGDITQKGYEKRRAALLAASAGHATHHGGNNGGLDRSTSVASMQSDYRQAHSPTRHMTAPLERPPPPPPQASSSHHPVPPYQQQQQQPPPPPQHHYHYHTPTSPYQHRGPQASQPSPQSATSHSSGHYSTAPTSADGLLQPSPNIDGSMRPLPSPRLPPSSNRSEYLSDSSVPGYNAHNGAASVSGGANGGGPMGPRPNPMLRADGQNIPLGGGNYQSLAPRSTSPRPVTPPGGVASNYQASRLHRRTPSNGSMRSISSVRTLDPSTLSRTASSEYRGGSSNVGPLPPVPQPPYMSNAYQHGRASLDQSRQGPPMGRAGIVHGSYPAQPPHSQYPPPSPHQFAGHPPPPHPPQQHPHPHPLPPHPPHPQHTQHPPQQQQQPPYAGYAPPNPHFSQVHHRMDSTSSAATFSSMSHFSRNGPPSHDPALHRAPSMHYEEEYGYAESVYSPAVSQAPWQNDGAPFSETAEPHAYAGRQALPQRPREPVADAVDRYTGTPLSSFPTIPAILRHRAAILPKSTLAYVNLDAKGKEVGSLTWDKLYGRAEKVAQLLRNRPGNTKGAKIGLVYRRSEVLDFLTAFHGCFLASMVAVPIITLDSLKELRSILSQTGITLVLSTDTNIKALTKDLQARREDWPTGVDWWKTNDLGSASSNKKKSNEDAVMPAGTDLAYLEFSKNLTGELKGVGISHRTVISQCIAIRSTLSTGTGAGSPNDVLFSIIEPRQQIGLIFTALMGVYSGHITVYGQSAITDVDGLWPHIMTRLRVTIAITDYAGIQQVLSSYVREPQQTLGYAKKMPPDISPLRRLFIDTVLPDPELDKNIVDCLLFPLGNRSARDAIAPISSLSEHGGMLLSTRDAIANNVIPQQKTLLLDREHLKRRRIRVVSRDDPQANDRTSVLEVATFGPPMPQVTVCIVDPESKSLCPPDVVGEVWVDSPALSGGFWGLKKHTQSIFRARPVLHDAERPGYATSLEQEFLRTGLLGCLIEGEVVLFGFYEDQVHQVVVPGSSDSPSMSASGDIKSDITTDIPDGDLMEPGMRIHYSPDITYTIMTKVDGVTACAVFDIFENNDFLTVVLLESKLRPDDMPDIVRLVNTAMKSYHKLQAYCVCISAPGVLPRTHRNGRHDVNREACRRDFQQGKLEFSHVSMQLAEAIKPLPAFGEEEIPESPFRNGKPQHTGIAPEAQVFDDRTGLDMDRFRSITDILIWRASVCADDPAYTLMDARGREAKTLTFRKLSMRVSSIANYFVDKRGLRPGDHVLLVLPHGLDFVASIHACLVLGLVAIPVAPPDIDRIDEDLSSLLALVNDFEIRGVIINQTTEDLLRSKPFQQAMRVKGETLDRLSNLINIGKVSSSKKDRLLGSEGGFRLDERWLQSEHTAMIQVYYDADCRRTAVRLSHAALIAQCRVQRLDCLLVPSRPLISCVRSYSGLGLLHCCMLGLYVGCQTLLITPADLMTNPHIYFEILNHYKSKDVYVTYPMMEHAMKNMQNVDYRIYSLQNVKCMMLACDGRPQPDHYSSLVQFFLANRLDDIAITTVYGPAINPMVSSRAYLQSQPQPVLLDLKSLRHGKITVLDDDDPAPSVLLHDAGKVPRNTMIAIVNPVSHRLCPPCEVGEIWVASACNAIGFAGSEAQFEAAMFDARIEDGDPRLTYTRTGDLGFLYPDANGKTTGVTEQFLYYLGPMEGTFDVRGLCYFPVDVETTIEQSHPNIVPNGCIVVKLDNQELVAIVKIINPKTERDALSTIPSMVSAVLDAHQLVLDRVVFVSSDGLPVSRLGEKRRAYAKHRLLEKQLPIIYTHRVTPRCKRTGTSSNVNSPAMENTLELKRESHTVNEFTRPESTYPIQGEATDLASKYMAEPASHSFDRQSFRESDGYEYSSKQAIASSSPTVNVTSITIDTTHDEQHNNNSNTSSLYMAAAPSLPSPITARSPTSPNSPSVISRGLGALNLNDKEKSTPLPPPPLPPKDVDGGYNAFSSKDVSKDNYYQHHYYNMDKAEDKTPRTTTATASANNNNNNNNDNNNRDSWGFVYSQIEQVGSDGSTNPKNA